MFGFTEIKLPKASELSGSRGDGISPFCKPGFISEAASRVLRIRENSTLAKTKYGIIFRRYISHTCTRVKIESSNLAKINSRENFRINHIKDNNLFVV